MQASEKIKAYSKAACDQIRWKKAHAVIAEELENHLADQRDAYMAAGESEEEATQHAVLQMGDPVAVGASLDRTHRPKPQWCMLFLTAALLAAGLFIRHVVIPGAGARELSVQLLFIAAGLAVMAAAYFMDFTLIGKYPKTFFLLTAATSVAVTYTSPLAHGAHYYGMYMTLLFPLAFAAVLYAFRNKGYVGLAACGLAYLLLCFLTLLVPTVSGLLFFTFCGVVLLLFSVLTDMFNVPKLSGCLLALAPFAVVVTYLVLLPGIRMRLSAVLNPTLHADDYAYVCLAIRDMLAKSRLLGHGAAMEPLFEPITGASDTNTVRLLTQLIYNEGWLAFILVSGVLLLFIVCAFRLCLRQKSVLGRLVSASVMLSFTAQALGYILNNLGFPLTDPISLPLISYGNVAMMLNLFLIGLALSSFRTGDAVKDAAAAGVRRESRLVWSEGKLIISFSRKQGKCP